MKSKNKSKKAGKLEIRKQRYFSDAFKRSTVDELVQKQVSIGEICKLYGVNSSTVYRWLYKYSPHHKKGTNQVIQMESEAAKTFALRQRVAELEQALGRKQLTIDFQDKLIEIAGLDVGYDIKKKYAQKLSNGLEGTGTDIPIS